MFFKVKLRLRERVSFQVSIPTVGNEIGTVYASVLRSGTRRLCWKLLGSSVS